VNADGVSVGRILPVLTLQQRGGQWNAVDLAPGVEWLRVDTAVGTGGDQRHGTRTLRVVPTAYLSVGSNETVLAGNSFDHADDVRLIFTDDTRIAQGQPAKVGIFPDKSPPALTADQLLWQPDYNTASWRGTFEADDDYFYAVRTPNLSPYAKSNADVQEGFDFDVNTRGSIEVIVRDGSGQEVMNAGKTLHMSEPNNPLNQKWNGKRAFEAADAGEYSAYYVWNLRDGRFVDSANLRMITVKDSGPFDGELRKESRISFDSTNGTNGTWSEWRESESREQSRAVVPGAYIQYRIRIKNEGDTDKIGAYTLTDTLPAGLTYVSATPPGATGTSGERTTVTWSIPKISPGEIAYAITVRVNETTSAIAFENKAVFSQNNYPDIVSNPCYHHVPTVTKNARVSTDEGVSYALTDNGLDGAPVRVESGDYIEYALTINNPWNSELSVSGNWYSLVDVLPPGLVYVDSTPSAGFVQTIGDETRLGWYYTQLYPAGDARNTVRVRTRVSVDTPTIFKNSATLNCLEGAIAGSIDSNTTYHGTDVVPPLTLKKSAQISTDNGLTWSEPHTGLETPDVSVVVNPGDLIRYTLTITNPRSNAVTGTPPPSLSDLLPLGLTFLSATNAGTATPDGARTRVTWNFASLPPGNTTVSVVARVNKP
jgi:uncharacterized repeat protein (TIGR01451 family)